MLEPGDIVAVDFPGAQGIKRRPAVVLSSTSIDHPLRDWQQAGLRSPSAFRAYIGMALISSVRIIGKLSAHDWQEMQNCLDRALG